MTTAAWAVRFVYVEIGLLDGHALRAPALRTERKRLGRPPANGGKEPGAFKVC